jgi:hypothetical protein
MLTGCATQTPPSEGRAPIEASLTSECPALEPMENATGAVVLRKLIEVSRLYYDCRSKHKRLDEAVEPTAVSAPP